MRGSHVRIAVQFKIARRMSHLDRIAARRNLPLMTLHIECRKQTRLDAEGDGLALPWL